MSVRQAAICLILLAAPCASATAQPSAAPPPTAFAPRIPYGDKDGGALLLAARKGDDAKVLALLKMGVPVDSQDNGWTSLQLAAGSRHPSTVRLLLAHGSNVHIMTYRGANGDAALIDAVTGTFYTPSDNSPSLYDALKPLMPKGLLKKHSNSMQKFFKRANKVINDWLRPDEEIIKMLLAHGVNVNDDLGTGDTPLMRAAFDCNVAILSLLISHGAKINAQDRDGESALMKAAMWPGLGSSDRVKFLLKSGASPLLRDKTGKTTLDYALQNPDVTMRQLLKQADGKHQPSHFSPAM